MYPNPNNGEQLFINLTELAADVQHRERGHLRPDR